MLAGDTVTYYYEATAMRPLASRPEWGLVLGTTTAVNQRGEMVFYLREFSVPAAPLQPLIRRVNGNFPLMIGF